MADTSKEGRSFYSQKLKSWSFYKKKANLVQSLTAYLTFHADKSDKSTQTSRWAQAKYVWMVNQCLNGLTKGAVITGKCEYFVFGYMLGTYWWTGFLYIFHLPSSTFQQVFQLYNLSLTSSLKSKTHIHKRLARATAYATV